MKRLLLLFFIMLCAPTWAEEPSLLVQNVSTSQILVDDHTDSVRPMASLTKLMTAMVALDHWSSTDQLIVKGRLRASFDTLLTNLLVRSSNSAAEIIANNYPGGRSSFILAMNERAKLLGMTVTEFHDASGLDSHNISTAKEIAKMLVAAGQYPAIRNASTTVEIKTGMRKRTPVYAHNTNYRILTEFRDILVSKTGFTNPAGRCLALLVNRGGELYAVVILGQPNPQAREQVARQLLKTPT